MTPGRQIRRAAGLATALVWGLVASGTAAVDVSRSARGIAVVSFAEMPSSRDADLPDVAALLAGALSAHSTARVVTPRSPSLHAGKLEDPQAADVRRWAISSAVDNVVVGRTALRGSELDVAVELRSGHSGATRAEYRLAPGSRDGLPGAVQRLAELILADLGDTASAAPPPAAPARSAATTPTAEVPGAKDELTSSGGLDLVLLPGSRRDDPISINSEELEVLPQDGGRRLVFSQNVEVLQGDISLNADRLEAVYPQGASQPERLLASGRVLVVQGDRRARCEEAVYERGPYTIVCRGKAEVLQACDRVRGEEIEFDLERERVRVTGAASVVIQSEGADATGCADAEREGR